MTIQDSNSSAGAENHKLCGAEGLQEQSQITDVAVRVPSVDKLKGKDRKTLL